MKRARKLLGILLAVMMLFSIGSQSVFAGSADSSPAEASSVSSASNVSKENSEDATSIKQVDKKEGVSPAASEEKSPVSKEKQNETLKNGEGSDSASDSSAASTEETSQSVPDVKAGQPASTEKADLSTETKESVPEPSEKIQTGKDTAAYNTNPITGSKTSDGVTVRVNAPEGSFPEGTALSISPLSSDEAKALASDGESSAAVAFDIAFKDVDGNKVQPQNGKTVNVTFSVSGGSNLSVENGEQAELQVIHAGEAGKETLGSASAPVKGSDAEVSVSANSFSPYAVVLRAPRRAPAATPREVPATVTNFTIQDVNGQDKDSVYWTSKFYLNMDWDASSAGADLHQGDYFDITLPDQMRFPSDATAADFNIYGDDNTTVIATAHVTPGANDTGGTVRVTFTDWVEGKENVKGNIHLAAQFDTKQIKTGEDNTFQVSVNGEVKPVTVHVEGPTELKPEVIGKWGQEAGSADEAEWYVRINHQKANLTNVVLTDHLSGGTSSETYIADSFVLKRVEMDEHGDITHDYGNVDLTDKLTIAPDGKSFTLNLGDIHGEQYRLYYRTTYTPGTRLQNNMMLTSTEKSETAHDSYTSAESGGHGSGNLANKIKLIKVDADDNSIVLAGAVFEVTRPDGSTFELTTGADGTVTSDSLTSGTYKVKEKTAPVGYELNTEEFTLQVSPDGGAVKTITDKKILISVSITKKWEDADNQDGIRPNTNDFASKVKLMNGTEEVTGYTPTVTDNGDGTYTVKYSDLPEYVNGSKADYKIAEDSIDGYTADKTSAADGETITNSHTPDTTEISITKKWADTNNQDGIRPSANEYAAKVHLMNGDTEVENVVPTVTDNGDGTYTVTYSSLPKNSNGTAINYTVKEDAVDGYEADQSTVSNGQTMTNTHTPETTSVSGTKTWDDNNDQDGARPESIMIRLLANGEEVQSKEVTASDNWSWTFSDLPKYKDGAEISYSVKEDAVTDYSASYEGANVTNTHTPGKTSISVSKVWNDSNNQDGKRPNDVTIHLLADGEDTGKTVTLNEANHWSAAFEELDAKKAGKDITYTVKEDDVAGYAVAITGNAESGYTVTNTHTPETVAVNGSKTWDDNNDQDGARPESITIRLLANGEEVQSKEVTASDSWSWTFSDLPKYKNGAEISYSVKEDAVTDYSASYDGTNVTNTHVPGNTSISVSKAWDDNNNQDGKRPESVTIHLLADGEDTGKTVTLNEANNWSASFGELDAKKAGKAIAYTVKEDDVAEYDVAITGDAQTGYTVTNTHTPETTSVSGTKTWDDNNDQDGERPEKITIRLRANGTEVTSKEVTAEDNWKWSFDNLDKYKNGKEITYTVTEDAVSDYTSEVKGYDVTNTHAPGKTSIAVTKAWNDSDNQDGKRPNDVTIHLLADGKDTGKTVTLNEANHWSAFFEELDAKKAGKAIAYTVKEDDVAEYDVAITGDAQTGYTVTNTHTPETVAVSGSKTWDDNNDQDGARPESITIRLLANGEEVQSKEVTVSDNWSWTFSELPKYKDGAEISYSVKEDAVTDYSASYEGANVTNTHTPGKTSISVSKVWNDRNDQDRIRPKSVTVHLLADGKDTGKVLTLNGENQWTGSFTDLDAYANGEKIRYSVTEDAVSGYQASITGDGIKGFTVVNTHTPDNKPPKPIPPTGSKTTRTGSPKTGYSSNSLLYGMLLAASLTAVIMLLIARRKKEAKE